jgi:hypothetical protein
MIDIDAYSNTEAHMQPAETVTNGAAPSIEKRREEPAYVTQDGEVVAPAGAETPGARREPSKFKLERWRDITFDFEEEWLVKHILPGCGVAAIYGKPGSYKSFVLFSLMLAVALGRPWAARRVAKGHAVYIGAEGSKGLRKRKAGCVKAMADLPADVDFHLISASPNLGTEECDLPALIKAIEDELGGAKPAVIGIDTVSKAIGAADENGAGMAAFVLNCEALSKHFGCLVIGVHHVGLGDEAQKRMRGHSSFHGGVDAQILCERPADTKYISKLTIQKEKDAEDGFCLEARLSRVVLGYDRDGDEISTLIVTEVVNADAAAAVVKSTKKVATSKLLLMDVLKNALLDLGVLCRPRADAPEVRVVAERHVRTEYFKRIAEKADNECDAATLYDRQDKSFKRAAKAALDSRTFHAAEYQGDRVFWLA